MCAARFSMADKPSPPVPQYRPLERFWPYQDLPENPTDEELAALSPDLREALFGVPMRSLSVTLAFPVFDGPRYGEAVARARDSAEYWETGQGPTFRHRARFYPTDALALRDLFGIVGAHEDSEVLIDDYPFPHARELWLPLFWLLIPR